jgi:hypothetical protein
MRSSLVYQTLNIIFSVLRELSFKISRQFINHVSDGHEPVNAVIFSNLETRTNT